MNNEQQTAMDTLAEWRDALHERVKSDEDRNNGNIHLWFALLGMRNAMNDALVAFGMPSFAQDLDRTTTTV